MYPYRKVEPLIPKDICPYCYIVRHERSQTFWDNYSIKAKATEDFKEGKVTKEQLRQEIVDTFVRNGWDKDCKALDDVRLNPIWLPSAYIRICPNCEIISGWQKSLELADSLFELECEQKIHNWFRDKVEQIIGANYD